MSLDASHATEVPTEEFIVFTLGKEECAIPLVQAREIIPIPEIIPVPGVPKSIRGVINVRGEVITVVDTEMHITGADVVHDEEHIVIVEKEDGQVFGLLVSQATEIVRTLVSNRQPVPNILENHPKAAYLDGVLVLGEEPDERIVLLVQLSKLLINIQPASSDTVTHTSHQ